MATFDHTITGGGTVGHPAHAIRPYIVQSKIFDAADDNLTANDVIKVIDLPDNSIVLGGCLDVLEAGGSSVTFDVGVSTDIDAFCDGVDGNADMQSVIRQYRVSRNRRHPWSVRYKRRVHSSCSRNVSFYAVDSTAPI